jgi:hypothetical protein
MAEVTEDLVFTGKSVVDHLVVNGFVDVYENDLKIYTHAQVLDVPIRVDSIGRRSLEQHRPIVLLLSNGTTVDILNRKGIDVAFVPVRA